MEARQVIVGRVSGLFGVRGWVKVESFTDPRDNILQYAPWRLSCGDEMIVRTVAESQVRGKGLIARFEGVEDRDDAARYVGADIRVDRDLFAREAANEYYWSDLEGMEVATVAGQSLGVVAKLLATGANDVMVVEGDRRRLIPFVIEDVVTSVDRSRRTIIVDWDPDF